MIDLYSILQISTQFFLINIPVVSVRPSSSSLNLKTNVKIQCVDFCGLFLINNYVRGGRLELLNIT